MPQPCASPLTVRPSLTTTRKIILIKIEHKDVLIGDKIRTTTKYKDGSEVIVSGIVARKNGDRGLYSGENVCFMSSYGDEGETTIELLERIVPKEYVIIQILKDGSEDLASAALWTKEDAAYKCAALQANYDTYTIGKYAGSKYEVRKVVGI